MTASRDPSGAEMPETVDDQLAIFREQHGFEWPNCATPDCENKCCTWSGTPFCHPCATRRVGKEEMQRRYDTTHDEDQRLTYGQ